MKGMVIKNRDDIGLVISQRFAIYLFEIVLAVMKRLDMFCTNEINWH